MDEDPKAKMSGPSARLIEKTDALLTLVQRLYQSKKLDFTPSYADLKRLKKLIEQRSQDPEVFDSVSSALKVLTEEIIKGLLKDKQLPKVKITKRTGVKETQKDTIVSIVGWEVYRPKIGRPYKVFLEHGGFLITSPVTKVLTGYVQTKNSVYEIEVLRES